MLKDMNSPSKWQVFLQKCLRCLWVSKAFWFFFQTSEALLNKPLLFKKRKEFQFLNKNIQMKSLCIWSFEDNFQEAKPGIFVYKLESEFIFFPWDGSGLLQ